MFAYEQEVRVVLFVESDDGAETLGQGVAWDPEKIVENVRVHPEVDDSFMQTVTGRALRACMEGPRRAISDE